MHISVKVKSDYLDLGHDVDNVKVEARVAVNFQVVLRNFKILKRIDIDKAYYFCLPKVYLIDELTNSIISIVEK